MTLDLNTVYSAGPAVRTEGSYVYRGAERNVLYLDSHLEWVPEGRFQEMIRRDNEYRRSRNLPDLPAE